MIDAIVRAGRFPGFVGRVLAALPAARAGEVVAQFERVAVAGLPIVAGSGVCVGLAAWFQVRRLLAAQGAEAALPSFLSVALLVELGPLLAGLLTAGRIGAGMAAELAAMNLNEEIDARVALGSDPIAGLVAPRTLACVLALPLLTVLVDVFALLGALGAEAAAGGMPAGMFLRQSLVFARLGDVVPATLKTTVFGMAAGIVSCRVGLESERSAEAVGRAATGGVVWSTLAVFAANAALAPLLPRIAWALGLDRP